jgi:glucosamine-6-phosphate deaminase
MKVNISDSKPELGRRAARHGANLIRAAQTTNPDIAIIVATGASQFEMLGELVKAPDIAWNRVTIFHLDEYVGMPITHGASFRKYLWERFHSKLPLPLANFHYINAEKNPEAECRRLNDLIKPRTIEVAFIGIGENGHLAFNDPPADFQTEQPYIVVNLDDACRKQQLGEGWFPTLNDVPRQAISMSIRQIMKSKAIVCTVPDARKAQAVKAAVESPVTPQVPASILQRHPNAELFLDRESAGMLKRDSSSR